MAVINRPDEFFDDLETMSSEAREKYHNEKLAHIVAHAYHHAPAVKELFTQAGLTPSQIQTIKDLEKLPITRKTDLIERQKAHPPYGGFSAIPPEEIDRVFTSPGPVYEPIQHEGIQWFAKSFWAAGFRKGDIVVNTFTYHLSPAGILFHEAIRDCGATAIPTYTSITILPLLSGYVASSSPGAFRLLALKRTRVITLTVIPTLTTENIPVGSENITGFAPQ